MQKLKVVRTGRVKDPAVRYTDPSQVYKRFHRELQAMDRETFIVLHLDGKNRLIARETVSVGSLNQTIVNPREVFKGAVLNGSAAIICVHNHPSGDPTPSRDDCNTTHRLKEAGNLLSINVLDHIIIGENSFYSFVQEGTMNFAAAPHVVKALGEMKKTRRSTGKKTVAAGAAAG